MVALRWKVWHAIPIFCLLFGALTVLDRIFPVDGVRAAIAANYPNNLAVCTIWWSGSGRGLTSRTRGYVLLPYSMSHGLGAVIRQTDGRQVELRRGVEPVAWAGLTLLAVVVGVLGLMNRQSCSAA